MLMIVSTMMITIVHQMLSVIIRMERMNVFVNKASKAMEHIVVSICFAHHIAGSNESENV